MTPSSQSAPILLHSPHSHLVLLISCHSPTHSPPFTTQRLYFQLGSSCLIALFSFSFPPSVVAPRFPNHPLIQKAGEKASAWLRYLTEQKGGLSISGFAAHFTYQIKKTPSPVWSVQGLFWCHLPEQRHKSTHNRITATALLPVLIITAILRDIPSTNTTIHAQTPYQRAQLVDIQHSHLTQHNPQGTVCVLRISRLLYTILQIQLQLHTSECGLTLTPS